MGHKLKQFRVNAGLTQASLAKAVGVSQPNYQRWESGASSIPDDKLTKLATVLQVDTATLLGRHAPIHTRLYNPSIGEDLNYYGEVSIHFRSGGDPLLLSISEGAFSRLYSDLQHNYAFVTIESLSNQTTIIRTRAIADLYFSSEAYDDYGPEHDNYENHVSLQLPDTRDWEIIEALANDDEFMFDDFSSEDIERISKTIMITDEQYKKLLEDGHIALSDLERERERNQKETDKIFDIATNIRYQLSNGKQRRIPLADGESIFESFHELTGCGYDMDDIEILLPIEGPHRIAYINKEALDYIMLPTHRFAEGRIEATAKMLDEMR